MWKLIIINEWRYMEEIVYVLSEGVDISGLEDVWPLIIFEWQELWIEESEIIGETLSCWWLEIGTVISEWDDPISDEGWGIREHQTTIRVKM
jgi:hypothetical protein